MNPLRKVQIPPGAFGSNPLRGVGQSAQTSPISKILKKFGPITITVMALGIAIVLYVFVIEPIMSLTGSTEHTPCEYFCVMNSVQYDDEVVVANNLGRVLYRTCKCKLCGESTKILGKNYSTCVIKEFRIEEVE